jgi:hypothetical protein
VNAPVACFFQRKRTETLPMAQNKRANKPRATSFTKKRQFDFLQALAETSNVKQSAKTAGVSLSTVYKTRSKNPEFARAWLAALWEGYANLEMEVLGRLREGDQKTKDGEKYDFANAIRLLSAHRDNAARAQAQQRNISATEIRDSIDRKVEEIRLKVMEEKAKQARER